MTTSGCASAACAISFADWSLLPSLTRTTSNLSAQLIANGQATPDQFRQAGFLVVDRGYDRQHGVILSAFRQ